MLPISPHATHGNPMPITRPQIKRGRTGCFTCRKRRKKCDETKPECVGCRRSGYICEGYPPSVHYQEHRSASAARGPAQQHSPSQSSTHTASQMTAWPQHEESRSWAPDSFIADLNCLNYFFQDDAMMPNFPEIGGILDSPQADSLFIPITENKTQEEIVPTTIDATAISQQGEGHSVQKSLIRSGVPRDLPFLIDGVESRTEQRFFFHFTQVTSRVLTLSTDQNNPLLTLVLPRSMQDPMIQRALLCLGGSHLVNQLQSNGSETPLFMAEKNRLLEEAEQEQARRLSALRSLKQGDTKKPAEFEAILTSALLLCLYEISEGRADRSWQVRLDAARDLIRNALEEQKNFPTSYGHDDTNDDESNDGDDERDDDGDDDDEEEVTDLPSHLLAQLPVDRFLLEFFIYHDILGGVTEPRSSRSPVLDPPSSSSTTSSPQTTVPRATHTNRTTKAQVYMIGINDGLFSLISRIATLRSQALSTRGVTPTLTSTVICDAIGLWQDLETWQPATETDPEQRLAFSAYISALFVWLFSIIYPDNMGDAKVQTVIKDGIRDMRQIQTSGVLAFLLFPAFVLGVASIQSEDRVEIESQFEKLVRFSGLGNVRLAYEVVKRSWAGHDAGMERSWDWMRQMDDFGISVPVT